MTLVGPNPDLLFVLGFVLGLGLGVCVGLAAVGISLYLTGSPQPHCGVCVCP